VFAMNVRFRRTYKNLLGSLSLIRVVPQARQCFGFDRGLKTGSEIHPRGSPFNGGFLKDVSHGTGGGIFLFAERVCDGFPSLPRPANS
jgi:hypothetical protein